MIKILTTAPSSVSTTYTTALKHRWEAHAWLHSTYTTGRPPTPCSEENASLFWFALFYSQCLRLILLTVVPQLKYVHLHPLLLQGAGVTLARSSWCVSPALPNAWFKKAESETVLSSSYWQTLTEVETSLPGRPAQATVSSRWKDSSAGQRADRKEQNLSLGNSQASKFGCDLKHKRQWWNEGQGDENVLTRSNVFWGILIHSFWLLSDRWGEL